MTGTRLSMALGALFLTMLVSACSDAPRLRFPTSPTLDTPLTPPRAPAPDVLIGTLSGVVFEVTSAGNVVPVEGVQVYCDACGLGHVSTYTDGNGAYSFTDVKAAVYPLLVAKRGYTLVRPTGPGSGGWMGTINAHVNGDTRFDIEVIQQ